MISNLANAREIFGVDMKSEFTWHLDAGVPLRGIRRPSACTKHGFHTGVPLPQGHYPPVSVFQPGDHPGEKLAKFLDSGDFGLHKKIDSLILFKFQRYSLYFLTR